MNLPKNLIDKINLVFSELNKNQLKFTQKNLTTKYKSLTGNSRDLIDGKNDSIIYAVSRMPATYSVLYTLVSDLLEQGFLDNINSCIDVGSGTGSVYFVLNDIFDDIKVELYERNLSMIDIFSKLSDFGVNVNNVDIVSSEINSSADLVTASYVLSEMTQQHRISVFNKLLDASSKYVLIVDTGTPATYENFLELRSIAKEKGYYVVAPCMSEKCPLCDDYCQFYARVERSSVLRQAKSAKLPYEDEKYFYLLFSKIENNSTNKRVIRRPRIKEKEVELTLCTSNCVEITKFTKANKELFKKARKIKINQLM